jgi:cell wall-associated NlpC family hydrolase
LKRLYTLLLLLSITTITAHAATTKTVKHTIKRGESLYTIAKKNHTTVARLCKINGISKNKILKAGHTIKVPVKYTAKKATKKKHLASKKHKKKATAGRAKVQERKLAKALVRLNSKTVAKVNIKKSRKFTLSDIVFGSGRSNGKLSKKSKKIIELAKKKLGRRYVWGAVGQKNTFDCSGLTSYVCKANGINIPRRAIEQSKYGKYVSRNELQPGDLIFFDTSKKRKGYVNHVGIYIGNGKFIHASSAKKKVIITSLNKPFYSQRYKGARRVASL